MSERARCGLCGEPMPMGEEMFKYHGYSGPCPKPAVPPAPVKPACGDGKPCPVCGVAWDTVEACAFDDCPNVPAVAWCADPTCFCPDHDHRMVQHAPTAVCPDAKPHPDSDCGLRGAAPNDALRELTFRELREANIARRDEVLRHARPGFRVEDAWSLNDWMTALTGEVGEAANLLKKVRRGDYPLDAIRDDLARELADVQTYLDLLAHAADIDLGQATAAKWNEVSERIGYPVRLRALAPSPVPPDSEAEQ